MCRRFVLVALVLAFGPMASLALAQCGCATPVTAYAPVVPSYTAYYAPAVTYAAPVSYAAYYAPAQPYVSYYAPAASCASCAAPVVQPYVVGYWGSSIYGTAKVYVPGEPVRNTWRAITP